MRIVHDRLHLALPVGLALLCLGCGDDGAPSPSASGPVLGPRTGEQRCFATALQSSSPLASDTSPGAAPEWLSAADCFDDISARVPGADLIPFAVASQLWTDGAAKQRYLVLPPGERIVAEDDGTWLFPVGSVLLKHFAYDVGGPRVVETRVLLRRQGGWEAHSYEWLPDGSDAKRLDAWKEASFDTPLGVVSHLFPARSSCEACHSPSAAFVLGPTTSQMNRQVKWEGASGNQIDALVAIEALETTTPASDLPAMPDPHSGASAEGRARAYLHANCAHCHRPGGWVPAELDMDLRYDRSLAETRTCGVPLQFGILFGKNRIEPGDPDASALMDRIQSQGPSRMPPMGTRLVDPTGVAVLREYIAGLKACPPNP
ncbi:MAG: hypothetical protein R3B13_01380 [Polyangiaceae bacterium]